MEKTYELLLPMLAQGGIGFATNMQKLHTINKAVACNDDFLSRQKMQQLLVQKHGGQC